MRPIFHAVTALLLLGVPSVSCSRAAPATAPATMPTTRPTNRLATEKSPYLLQHAHNPVDWYPWGAEAFEKAKKEGKLIFLSVGYSTCHWCHVMERESFESPEIAKLINEMFVPVKVDREERPDVDRVYMTFVQASTGSGGWPMTVFLTPDLKPVFGGTYFPPEDRGGMPGIKKVLTTVHETWKEKRVDLEKTAEDVTNHLKQATERVDPARLAAGGELSDAPIKAAHAQFIVAFDEKNAGFGRPPKFPEPSNLEFLLHHHGRTGDAKSKEMALATLDAMAAGGMYDHLGGGFHRYSTDERWFLPHFEKMLYDQAQLISLYVDAHLITGDAKYAAIARETLDYVMRELSDPKTGAFYSAEDADSLAPGAAPDAHKTEGAFYVWSEDELRRIVGDEAYGIVAFRFGVADKGNVDRDPHGEFPGKNVLYAAQSIDETAKKFGKTAAEIEAVLTATKGKLLAARDARPHPHLDDKVLVAWNGLMISAAAHAGSALGDDRYTQAAVRAATFIREKLYDPKTHTLQRRYRDGHADVDGFLDDYAFFTQGLLDLYEATLDIQWLRLAMDLQTRQDELFWDDTAGCYYATSGRDATVLLRMRDESDGAEPSPTTIAVRNGLRLSQMTDDEKRRTRADRQLKLLLSHLSEYPLAMPQMLTVLDFRLDKPKQIVLAGKPDAPDTRKLLAVAHGRYIPNKVILSADGAEGQKFLTERLEFIKDMKPLAGEATAFVCQNYVCQLPTSDPEEMAKQLVPKKP